MWFTIQIKPHMFLDFRHIGILLSALYGGLIVVVVSCLILVISRTILFSNAICVLAVSRSEMLIIALFTIFISRLKLSILKK